MKIPAIAAPPRELLVALIGNPNCGKTTLFNALTGLRQKVGNYPGVTVERKEGRGMLPDGTAVRFIDLPGLYSLTPHSPDEEIARDVLLGLRSDTPRPDLILNVVDAGNLERNLYVTSQILDTGIPTVIALTMTDLLHKQGKTLDVNILQHTLGVPVCAVVVSRREGLDELMQSLVSPPQPPAPAWLQMQEMRMPIEELSHALHTLQNLDENTAFAAAVILLMQEPDGTLKKWLHPQALQKTGEMRAQQEQSGIDFAARVVEARYAWSGKACGAALVRSDAQRKQAVREGFDRFAMHPFWGYVIFFSLMTVVFQAIFSLGQQPATAVQNGVTALGQLLTRWMPDGPLRHLINDGALGGVGTTLSFLPQILLLFFFIGLLEDTGYMTRAAILMDRLMSRVGLHGRSFIPLLSSFACAIPGIMATRTIGDRKARLITILIAPLMSCSARLPVYLLMTSAFIPNNPLIKVGGMALLTLQGAIFVAMYFLGMAAAFCMAWLFHRTLLKGEAPNFLMELPPYRMPALRSVLMQMLERALLFVKKAGTIILAVSTLVWFLSTYPLHPKLQPDAALRESYLGHIGHAIEPVIRPLGFNWKTGVGIASSFVAREVFVSTMGTVYNVGETESRAGQADLGRRMKADTNPRTGLPVFTPLTAVCLMVYYVLAMQCMSTIAVVKRETNGWKWPMFQLAYMTALAWGVTFLVYHAGLLLGWGVK